MAYISMFVLIVLGVGALTAVVTAIYMVFYKYTINKRLENPGGRRLLPPYMMPMIAIIILLLIFLMIRIASSSRTNEISQAMDQVYQFKSCEYNTGTGYMSGFSSEENPGYTKSTEVIEGMEYTLFVSEDRYDTMHPSFILAVKSLYDEDFEGELSGSFLTLSGEDICGVGYGVEWQAGETKMFFGNTSAEESRFRFRVSLAEEEEYQRYVDDSDRQKEGEEPVELEDYASKHSEYTFTYEQPQDE